MMKKYIMDFLRRGSVAMGLGPIILAFLYLILHRQGLLDSLSVNEVCLGIFSLSALAFMAGGMNFLYQIERLPLMLAILIHGSVLYVGYLATYLLNGWLERDTVHVLVFSGIFVLGYLVIWGVIYSIVKHNTDKINKHLRRTQSSEADKASRL